jgi:hypothetical protein
MTKWAAALCWLAVPAFAQESRPGPPSELRSYLDGCARLVGFTSDRLQIFDLHDPEFLVEAYAAPSPDGHLVRFHWQGPPAARITVVRDSAGHPTGLKFEGSGTAVTYKRLTSK